MLKKSHPIQSCGSRSTEVTQETSIEHLSREANQVAHELARQAMITKENCIWDDDTPSFIVQLLSNDVTIFDQ
jgi:hypothetical protein